MFIIQMKLSISLMLILCLIALIGCKTTMHSGLYRGADYTRGMIFVIKRDSTFEYRLLGHMISDTSAGRYYLAADTITFNYSYDRDSSALLHSPVPARPKFAVVRTNRLYLFYGGDLQLAKQQMLRLYK